MADAARGAQRVAAVDGTVAGVRAAGPGDVRWVHGSAGSGSGPRSQNLVAETRLVTLTGSGGCGKTRLAFEVAGDVAPGFEHGAWWVELSWVIPVRCPGAGGCGWCA